MRRLLRLLFCLPLLAATACAADAIAGPTPEPVPQAPPRAATSAAPAPEPPAAFARVLRICRATTSPRPTEPLYLVDGVPATDSALVRSIDPRDIESIELVRGAAAAALYGTRAAEGVVIITTKPRSETRRRLEASYRRPRES